MANVELDESFLNDEDQAWVLDSLIGFLKSPLWSSSLSDFIDQKSIVFDPNEIEDDNGEVLKIPEYEAIFDEYRSLIDRLISSHMAELEISEIQFVGACEMAEGVLAERLKQILFEELWAAENYEVFIRLMAKRNVELQLEALEMLARKFGLIYDVFVPLETSSSNFFNNDQVMCEAILRSLQLPEEEEKNLKPKNLLMAIKPNTTTTIADVAQPLSSTDVPADLADSDERVESEEKLNDENIDDNVENENSINESVVNAKTIQQDQARLVEFKQQAERKMNEALQSALENKTNELTDSIDSVRSDNFVSTNETTSLHLQNDKNNDEVIAKRAEYLRAQRDKILNTRHQKRTEMISKYLTNKKNNIEQPRPKTGKQQANKQETAASDLQTIVDGQKVSKEMAYRKALAARLKAEVVNKKE